jgi:hypothetical protein
MEQQEHPISLEAATEVRHVVDGLWLLVALMAIATLLLGWGMESVLVLMVGAFVTGIGICLWWLHLMFCLYVYREDPNRDV